MSLAYWHESDITDALRLRGWTGPELLEAESYFVGKTVRFERGGETLVLSYVADVGEGFTGSDSLEEVVGSIDASRGGRRLWLERTRSSRWRKRLTAWADAVSASDAA